MTIDERARATLRRWKADPISFVRDEFQVEPDAWQAEALSVFPTVNRLAMKACKGPGKTAVLAWMVLNFLATRPHCRIACVSITADNLSQNLWPELAKWMGRSPFLSNTFEWTKTQLVHKTHSATWWAQARSWAKQADAERQADALAGLHEDFALAVLDESGGIPQAVMATAEAVLLSGIETKVIQAGNPTHTTGPLYRACTSERHLWHVVTITGDPDNPNRSPRISLERAKEQIALWGRDNPWVKVNIFGEFPDASLNALLGVEEVEAAMHRHYRQDAFEWSQKRIGVDAARFGDDPWVLFPRQGVAAFRPVVMRGPRSTEVADRLQRAMQTWKPELILFDDTGHFGHGAMDLCLAQGLPVVPVIYSNPASDKRYKNVRAQMYCDMADWVKAGGALPNDPELVAELTEPTYTFQGGQFVLEPKEDIKARIGRSPNKADALAQTFAFPDQPSDVLLRMQQRQTTRHDFDPFEHSHVDRVKTEFDPFEVRL